MENNVEKICGNVAEIIVSYSAKIKSKDRLKVRSSEDAYRILHPLFPSLEHVEYFFMLVLNRTNDVLGFHMVSKGGIAGTVTDIRVIFQIVLKANGSSVIVAHNHPSGNLQPSEADIKITKKTKEAGLLLDIALLDHLILTNESYLSMADQNLM